MLPLGEERWMMIRTTEHVQAARRHLQKKASKEHAMWEKRLWHLSTQSCACDVDAHAAWKKAISTCPVWEHTEMTRESSPSSGKAGRLGANTEPVRIDWNSVPMVQVDQLVLERNADHQARFLLATNELSADTLSDEALLAVSQEQGRVERGFRFVKDPVSWHPRSSSKSQAA
jgi:transposase